ncbi:hypothetical protein [Streptomyces sp. NPDC101115]|uniref:hypothetical protein n=1 Tax=Streptomyces sp. NPDC101115 TaxID=3366106 RepID=UPI00380FBB2D
MELRQRFAASFAKEVTVSSHWKTALRMPVVRTPPKTPWKNLIARKIREGISEEIRKAANAVPLKGYAGHAGRESR